MPGFTCSSLEQRLTLVPTDMEAEPQRSSMSPGEVRVQTSSWTWNPPGSRELPPGAQGPCRLTHSEDINTYVLKHASSHAHIILGLAIRHQDHHFGCLWTETRHWLQVLSQHMGQGKALGTK